MCIKAFEELKKQLSTSHNRAEKTTVGGRVKNLGFGRGKKIDFCYWTRCSERKTRKNDGNGVPKLNGYNTEQSKLFTASAGQGARLTCG